MPWACSSASLPWLSPSRNKRRLLRLYSRPSISSFPMTAESIISSIRTTIIYRGWLIDLFLPVLTYLYGPRCVNQRLPQQPAEWVWQSRSSDANWAKLELRCSRAAWRPGYPDAGTSSSWLFDSRRYSLWTDWCPRTSSRRLADVAKSSVVHLGSKMLDEERVRCSRLSTDIQPWLFEWAALLSCERNPWSSESKIPWTIFHVIWFINENRGMRFFFSSI